MNEIKKEQKSLMKAGYIAAIIGLGIAAGGIVFFMYTDGGARGSTSRRVASAYASCQQAVLADVKYPSKAEFSLFNWDPLFKPGQIGEGRVDLMNGFGAMIPHKWQCVVKSDGVAVAALFPDE